MKSFILIAIAAFALSGCANQFDAGNEAFARGDWKKAIFHFDHVAGTNANRSMAREMTAKAYFNWGKEQFSQRKWDDAIVHLGKVRREDEDYAAARELIGDTNYYKGKEAFDHGAWKKAIWFLNIVRSSNSHYQESRVLVRAAKAKLEQVVPDTLPLAVS